MEDNVKRPFYTTIFAVAITRHGAKIGNFLETVALCRNFCKIDEKKEQQEIIQTMNILFFLTPKEDVAHVDEDDTMRQVLEKMEHHGYTAIPLLSREGKYIGTITEGDLLWFLKDRNFPDLKLLEDMPITSIQRRRDNEAVKIDESMEDLFGKVMNQNFVPVVDDKRVFIGIVTRKDILAYLGKKAAAQENGARGMDQA